MPCLSVRLVATCLTVALGATAVEAQERLEIITLVDDQVRLIELDATVSGFGRILDVQRLPRSAHPASPGFFPVPAPPVVVSGGRYVVWTQAFSSPELQGQVVAFDRRTRQIFDASPVLPRDQDGGPVRFIRILGVDPRRPRLFLSSQVGLGAQASYATWTLDLDTLTAVRTGSQQYQAVAAAYAANVDALFYWDTSTDASQNTQVSLVTVNASTGQEIRRWSSTSRSSALHTDPDGRFLWLDRNGSLERVDAATGATLAQAPQFTAANVVPDEPRGLLLVRQGDFLAALDPLSLVEIGRTRVAYSPVIPDRTFDSQSVGGAGMTGAYTLRAESSWHVLQLGRTGRNDIVELTCTTLNVDALDTGGARRATVDLLGVLDPRGQSGVRDSLSPCVGIAVAVRAPVAPTSLAAGVAGHTVSLSWSHPGNADTFMLEFGVTPGQRMVSAPIGRTSALTVQNVPPGVYYVRVRATNEVGTSPVSNEVRVVVP